MNQKNVDHVAVYPDLSGLYWSFTIATDAMTCNQVSAEMVTHVTELFKTFEDFLIPIELSYQISVYEDEGQRIPVLNEKVDPVVEVERQLNNDSGIRSKEFVASTRVPYSGSSWIPRVPFETNQVKIQLASGERYVDRNNGCVSYRNGEPLDRQPSWDPLAVTIVHYPLLSSDEQPFNSAFHIMVQLRSDIWFEPTEIGRENRKNLSDFLSRIDSGFEIEKIDRNMDWEPPIDLEEIY